MEKLQRIKELKPEIEEAYRKGHTTHQIAQSLTILDLLEGTECDWDNKQTDQCPRCTHGVIYEYGPGYKCKSCSYIIKKLR